MLKCFFMHTKMYKNVSITSHLHIFVLLIVIALLIMPLLYGHKRTKRFKFHTRPNPRKICIRVDQTLKARQKTCFLRPDTGPCRADIIQWYYDVRQAKCYRFYWGGCQGNGNKFETRQLCKNYCRLNTTYAQSRIPHYCSLTFDYGNCFGYFNRWTWDTLTKSCRRRLYSVCGCNQNNFQSLAECTATCLNPPNNTIERAHYFTTCIPLHVPDIH